MSDSRHIHRTMRSFVRGAVLLLALVVVGSFIGDSEAVRVLFIAAQAVFATTAIATMAQWAFTTLNFTEQRCKQYEESVDEIIVAARVRTLGMIYIGVSIVVGLVYFATYRGTF